MRDDEILEFLKNKPTHACGRFRVYQLKSYSYSKPVKINPGLALLKAGFLSLLLVLLTKQTSAQNTEPKAKTEVVQHADFPAENSSQQDPSHTVKGVVKDEYGELLPGVNIVLKGTTMGITTDFEGRFEFPLKLSEGDILVFSFIGLVTKEYRVPKKMQAGIDVVMDIEMDLDITGELLVDGLYNPDKTGLRGLWCKVKSLF